MRIDPYSMLVGLLAGYIIVWFGMDLRVRKHEKRWRRTVLVTAFAVFLVTGQSLPGWALRFAIVVVAMVPVFEVGRDAVALFQQWRHERHSVRKNGDVNF